MIGQDDLGRRVGFAELEDHGTIEIELSFHNGDDAILNVEGPRGYRFAFLVTGLHDFDVRLVARDDATGPP